MAATRRRSARLENSGKTEEEAETEKPQPRSTNKTKKAAKAQVPSKKRASDVADVKAETPQKKRRVQIKSEPEDLEQAHGIKINGSHVKQEPQEDVRPSKPGKKNAKSKVKAEPKADLTAGASLAKSMMDPLSAAETDASTTPSKSKGKGKSNNYGLTPGQSPYPTYPHPTPEECHAVRKALASVHGDISAPATIPAPSLQSSGCGEVPSVLDALVRTRLSAATNNANSSRAFRGLVEAFGVIKEGVGKGSVDWELVRTSPVKKVFEAIKTGGLADVKSRDIQSILNMVSAENEEERQKGSNLAPAKGVLSLDHVHGLDNDTAFAHLLRYPGIGPKTASCVLLFCMQRPSFAVDTHVFRLTRWLGWTPSDAQARAMNKRGESKSGGAVTRESTYAHLDVRVPDELKYPLHYLLIRHGKSCGWCSAKAGKDAKVAGSCVLRREGLIGGKKGKGVKGEEEEENEEDEEDEEEAGDEDDE